MKLKTLLLAAFAAFAGTLHADPLKIGYSDWLGYGTWEVAKQKNWFKEAGVDVELVYFDYTAGLDAYTAGKLDGIACVATDALVIGANGAKSKIIALIDYSDGADMIIGKPGVNSIKELKGQKIGVEATLVDHLLLMKALEANGMKQSDVEIVNTPTNDTPQTLTSGKVAAIGAWYPVSGQALKAVAGSKPIFTSAEAKGLIYDVLAVSPTSLGKRRAEWEKVVKVFYKTVDYILDPKTQPDAVKIMAAKAGVAPEDFTKAMPGCHYLTLAETKTAFQKGDSLMSIYGSMAVGNKFNLDNAVYKVSQKPETYLAPAIVNSLK